MKLDKKGARLRICELLEEGIATYDEIRADEIVAAECAEKDLALHNRSFLAYREGVEFKEYCRRCREWSGNMQKNTIAAVLVEANAGSDNIARIAEYKLLQLCLEKLEGGEDLTDKEVRAISGAVAGYNRNRIAQEKEDGKRAAAEKEAEYQARIAELSATIEQLTGKAEKQRGISDEALKTIEEKVGLL
ncbi:MAG: hypothetical protein PHP98_10595 [Kiritimatiellae bacterium]|nr:hypothetical protein [Kiritimatiellia bacterium]